MLSLKAVFLSLGLFVCSSFRVHSLETVLLGIHGFEYTEMVTSDEIRRFRETILEFIKE